MCGEPLDNRGMPRFLIALQGNGFADHGICLERRPGLNHARGRTLGRHRFVPHGQAVKTLETILIDLGPVMVAGSKATCVSERTDKKALCAPVNRRMRARGILVPLCGRAVEMTTLEIQRLILPEPILILAPTVELPRCVLGSIFHTRQEAVIHAGIPVGACSTLEVVESWNPYLLQFPTHVHFLFFKGREADHCQ